jgi:hypothetical protein
MQCGLGEDLPQLRLLATERNQKQRIAILALNAASRLAPEHFGYSSASGTPLLTRMDSGRAACFAFNFVDLMPDMA